MGYINYSKSVNAAIAESNGRLPLSKWTKRMIVNLLDEIAYDKSDSFKEKIELIKKFKFSLLKSRLLENNGEWHHYGLFYKEIKVYGLVEIIDEDDVVEIIRLLNYDLEQEKKKSYEKDHAQEIAEKRKKDAEDFKKEEDELKRFISTNKKIYSISFDGVENRIVIFKNGQHLEKGLERHLIENEILEGSYPDSYYCPEWLKEKIEKNIKKWGE